MADTTLPRVDGTRGGKSSRRSGTCRGFKTPNLLQLSHFLGSEQLKISRKTGEDSIHSLEGPNGLKQSILSRG